MSWVYVILVVDVCVCLSLCRAELITVAARQSLFSRGARALLSCARIKTRQFWHALYSGTCRPGSELSGRNVGGRSLLKIRYTRVMWHHIRLGRIACIRCIVIDIYDTDICCAGTSAKTVSNHTDAVCPSIRQNMYARL